MSASSRSAPKLSPVKHRSRGKTWTFRALALILIVVTIELASLALWSWMPFPDWQTLRDHQHAVAAMGTERGNELEALHPYFGWAINPDGGNVPMQKERTWKANSLGFVDEGPSLRRKSPDTLIVGVLGGSVAQQMTTIGDAAFRKRLTDSPVLKGRQVEVVRMALSGFKQPQQLMALNYVLALGGEFDVIVNIDGYNETALAIAENDIADVFVAYPRLWHARLQDVVDPRTASISNRLLGIRARRQAWGQWIVKTPLQHSPTVSLLWAIQDQNLKNQQSQLGLELIAFSRKEGRGFARQGPHQLYHSVPEMFEHVTNLWRNSSLQMHHLCSGRGALYLHCLQPNQYHEGSKPLSPHELSKCYAIKEAHAQAVKTGYPRLIDAGESLQIDGVRFHDLTGLFSSETDTIYSDYFCHYNARGTNMLAEAVADQILQALESQ